MNTCLSRARCPTALAKGHRHPQALGPSKQRTSLAQRVRTNAVVEVSQDNFEAEVLKADVPVVADFWASWCGPCKLIDPLMKKLDSANEGKIKVVKIEVDGNPDIVEKYGVYGLPSLVLFRDGAVVDGSKHEGAIAMNGIKSWLDSYGVASA